MSATRASTSIDPSDLAAAPLLRLWPRTYWLLTGPLLVWGWCDWRYLYAPREGNGFSQKTKWCELCCWFSYSPRINRTRFLVSRASQFRPIFLDRVPRVSSHLCVFNQSLGLIKKHIRCACAARVTVLNTVNCRGLTWPCLTEAKNNTNSVSTFDGEIRRIKFVINNDLVPTWQTSPFALLFTIPSGFYCVIFVKWYSVSEWCFKSLILCLMNCP